MYMQHSKRLSQLTSSNWLRDQCAVYKTDCVCHSSTARIFKLNQMHIHKRRPTQMKLSNCSQDMGTTYRLAINKGQEYIFLVLEVPRTFRLCQMYNVKQKTDQDDLMKLVTGHGYNIQTSYKMRTRLNISGSPGTRTFKLFQVYLDNERLT